jgi:hypothetical protein
VVTKEGKRIYCGTFVTNLEAEMAIQNARPKKTTRSMARPPAFLAQRETKCSKCGEFIWGAHVKMQSKTENELQKIGAAFCKKKCRTQFRQFHRNRLKKAKKPKAGHYIKPRVINRSAKGPEMTEIQRAIMERKLAGRVDTDKARALLIQSGFSEERVKTTFRFYTSLVTLPKLNQEKKIDLCRASSPDGSISIAVLRFSAGTPGIFAFKHCVALSDLFAGLEISRISAAIREVFLPRQMAPMNEDGKKVTRQWKRSQYWMAQSDDGVASAVLQGSAFDKSVNELLVKVQPLATNFIKSRAGGVPLSLCVEAAFVTQYLPDGENSSGLGWHLDDGRCTVVVQLSPPVDKEPTGGGLFISAIEGLPAEEPKTEDGGGTNLRLEPGTVAIFDRQVWHRAAHITAGERWVAVFVFVLKIPELRGP